MTPTRRHFLRATLALSAATLIAGPAFAQKPAIYANDGIAIDGTDTVAYFTQGAPVAGSPDITYEWRGATWRFASMENRDTFAADPEAYAPQFGGYCAYAVSEGTTASTIPEAWKIVDGKLYLNFSNRFHRRWERTQDKRIADAHANWPEVLN
ncbi:MAG: YHS domain-containing (seleno)protein [Sulfitobacter sp.]